MTKGWKVDHRRIDKIHAITTSIVAYAIGLNDQKEKYEMAALCWKSLNMLMDENVGDLAMDACEELVRAGLARKRVPDFLKKAAEPVIYRMGKSDLPDQMK